MAGDRRVDGDDDAAQRQVGAGGLKHGALPERVRAVLDQLAVEFLPAEQGPPVAADHGVEKACRQVLAVGVGGHARDDGQPVRQQPTNEFRRPRRGSCHLTGPIAEAQGELQHVPGRLGVRPFADFIAPGGGKLRAAEAFGVGCRQDQRLGPIRPQ